MKKLSKISESIWSDIQDRSAGEVVRDEDKFNPDYVDFGPDTTVYWAIDNLEIDGEVKFYFDDVKDYNNNGWRLPTVDEVNQLKWNIRIYWLDGCKHLKFDDEQELKLKTNGSGGFHMWTKEINTKFPSSAYAYGFNNSHDFDVTNFNKSINRLFVFLVKDKKITESIWSDIQDRSTGETIRKEDAFISNIKDIKPVDLGKDFPVYWADIDLEVNGEDVFDWEEVQDMLPQIEKTGWRLPKAPNEIYDMFGKDIRKRDTYLKREWIPGSYGVLSSKETGESLYFPTTNQYSESYWCNNDWKYHASTGRVNFENERCFDVSRYSSYDGIFSLIRINNMNRDKKIKVRLVKDK